MKTHNTLVENGDRLRHCSLFTVRCSLPQRHCSLFTVRCSLPQRHCSLFAVRCSLPQRHCSLFAVRCSLKGFTLVELLTVIVIISILASLSLFALNTAYEEAKIAKTRGTIQKLDAAIQQIFEEYEDKFDALTISENQTTGAANVMFSSPPPPATTQRAIAKSVLKLHYIRDIMRMEMPQQWTDVFDTASTTNATTPADKLGPLKFNNANGYVATEPAVLSFYYSTYEKYVNNGGNAFTGPSTAALLYMIIANLNPEALENFHGSEIADTDGDGLLEFIDAWGHPIEFIRWAPGFTGGDKQPDIVGLTGIRSTASSVQKPAWDRGPNNSTLISQSDWNDPLTISDLQDRLRVRIFKEADTSFPDPFDQKSIGRGWFLYPLIYSAGPDGVADIYTGSTRHPVSSTISSFGNTPISILDPFINPWGMPDPNSGTFHSDDNIHNHRSAGSF